MLVDFTDLLSGKTFSAQVWNGDASSIYGGRDRLVGRLGLEHTVRAEGRPPRQELEKAKGVGNN